MKDRKGIGDVLQRLRIRAGFRTAKDFAKAIGMNPDTYTGYEQGKGMFTYERAWQLADALQCSLDELGGREWPPDGPGALTPTELSVVDDYRRMDADDRPGFVSTAHALAYAGEAKKAGDRTAVELELDGMSNGNTQAG